jgi:hypothetical protein
MRQRFATTNFEQPIGLPEFDQRIYFAHDEWDRPVPDWVRPHTSARWTGYLEVPRDAEYTVGTNSDDGSWVYIDDTLQVTNEGVHQAKVVTAEVRLTRGYHRVRVDYFQAGGGATMKLSWKVSGLNGVFEIIPLSMLYPEQPPGPTRLDRALRLAPWLLLFLAGWLLRPQFPAQPQRRQIAAAGALVFAVALGVRSYGLLSEGETCDQWVYVSAGYVYAQNIAAGIVDDDQWAWNFEHPIVGKLIYGAAQFVFGTDTWVVNFTASVLSAVTAWLVFLIGLELFGLAAGVASGLVLALLPPVIAHGRVAALETPSAFFTTLAMFLLIRGLREPAGSSWSFGGMQLATGLAIGTKLSNAVLLPLMCLALIIAFQREIFRPRLRLGEIPWSLYGFPFTPFLVLTLWPWMWKKPQNHFQRIHDHWANFSAYETYFGQFNYPPRTYFLAAFAFVTPLLLFAPFAIGCAQLFRRSPALAPRVWWALVLGWFVLPFSWALIGYRMNGIRYLYNSYPPFALLTGAGLVVFGQAIGDRWRMIQPAVSPTFVGAVAVYLAVADVRIYPYYLDYFNEATGGPANVYKTRLLATGWWGEGFNRAVAWLNEHAALNDGYSLKSYTPPGVLDLRPDLRLASDKPRWILDEMLTYEPPPGGYTEAYVVSASGAPIVKVYERDPPRRVSPNVQALAPLSGRRSGGAPR